MKRMAVFADGTWNSPEQGGATMSCRWRARCGGYDERGLSDCAAQWMSREAGKSGFKFEPHLTREVEPDPEDAQHNERKGIYRARKEFLRPVVGPVHKTVKARWLADTHGYRKKSKAPGKLLDSVNNDWSEIEVMR